MSVQPPADWLIGLTPVDHPDHTNTKYFTLSDLYRDYVDPFPFWDTTVVIKPKPGIVPGGVILGRKSSTAPHSNRKGEYDSPIISRNHAQLLITPAGKVYIIDLGSLHGLSIQSDDTRITINNKRTAYQLCTGDTIVLGKDVSSRGKDYQPYLLSVKFRYPSLSELGILSRGRILNLTPEMAREVFASETDNDKLQRLLEAESNKAHQTKVDDEDEEDVTFIKQRHFTPPGLSQTTALSVYDSDAESVVSDHESISDHDSQVHSPRTNTYRVPSSLLYASEDDHEWPRGSSAEQEMDGDDNESFTDVEDEEGPEIMSSKSQGRKNEAAISPPRTVEAAAPSLARDDNLLPHPYNYADVASNLSDDETEPEPRPLPSGLGVWYSYTDELVMPRPSRPIQFPSMEFSVAPIENEGAPPSPAASPHYSPVSPDANSQARSKASPKPVIRSAARDVQSLYEHHDVSPYELSTYVYPPLEVTKRLGNNAKDGSIVNSDDEIDHTAADAEDMNSDVDHSIQADRDEDEEHQDELCSQQDLDSDSNIGFKNAYGDYDEGHIYSDDDREMSSDSDVKSEEEDDVDDDGEEGYGEVEDSEEEDHGEDEDENEDMDEDESDDEQENEVESEDEEDDLSSDNEFYLPNTVIPTVKTAVGDSPLIADDENKTQNKPLGHVMRPLEAAVNAEMKRSEADQQAAKEQEKKDLRQEVQAMFEKPVPASRQLEIGVQTSIIEDTAPAVDVSGQTQQIAGTKQEPILIPCNNQTMAAITSPSIDQPDSDLSTNTDDLSDVSSEGPITPKNNKRSLPDDFVLDAPAAGQYSSCISVYGPGPEVRPIKRMRNVKDDIKMIAIGAVLGSALTVTGLLKYANAG